MLAPAYTFAARLHCPRATQQSSPDRPFLDRSNAADLSKQSFYQFLEATWVLQGFVRIYITTVSLIIEWY